MLPLHKNSLSGVLILALVLLIGFILVPGSRALELAGQTTPTPEVYAEVIIQANLRGGPSTDYPILGEIMVGTRYQVVAQHAYVPWLQLDVPQVGAGIAWVFADLVTVTGNTDLVPVIQDFSALATVTPTIPPTATSVGTPPPPVHTSPTPTLIPTVAGPRAVTLGETNIRFGPDIEYPIIIQVPAGMSYSVVERHALVPWVRITLDASPTGSGWIYRDVVEIIGNLDSLPATSNTQFTYPTLTPTPQTVMIGNAPWVDANPAPGTLAATLGQEMHAYLLNQGFEPYSGKMASVFVMDLQTGDSFTLNDGIAFSGMSLTKIPILVAYFQRRYSGPLSRDEAYLVTNTMMCSENITTNTMLKQLGDGDPLQGAQHVSQFTQNLGLGGTFIMRQYVLREDEPPVGVSTITTGADQTSARPDLYNQVVPQDIGWLLAGVYQCAQDETGLLIERYPDTFDAQKCRRMLHAMDANEIGVFLEAGVPPGTRVVHKHGWVNDTHGDAGIVIGPDGAYVFVAVLYAHSWLQFDQSSPIIAELSRMTWNTLNPTAPLDVATPGIVPDQCDVRSDPVIGVLMNSSVSMIGP